MASRRGKIVYGSRRWKGVRRAAIAKAGHVCERCGRPGRLEVHHIHKLTTEEGWRRCFDLGNLLVLCRACHFGEHRVESTVRGADAWAKEIGLR